MKKSPLAICLFIFVLCMSSLADTLLLTNGEKLEGKITAESPDEITISLKISAAITDERTIKRADIQKIEMTTPDEIAYEQIKNLKPDPLTAQTAATERAIGALKSFQEKFPESPHKADVQAGLDLFQKEKVHRAAGDMKFYGAWITKKEAGERNLQIQAQALILAMREQTAQGDLIGALNTFDRLEKNYGTTRAYPIAVELAKQILPVLLRRVNHSIEKLRYDTEAWKQGPEALNPEISAARKAEQEQFDAVLAQVQQNQIKWPPLIPRSDKSLDALQKLIPPERVRLAALPLDKMTGALLRVDKAREAIDAKDTAGAESLLAEAAALWPQNEDATYWKKVLTDRQAVEAKRAAAAAKTTPAPVSHAKPTSESTPQPAASAAPAVKAPVAASENPKNPSSLPFRAR